MMMILMTMRQGKTFAPFRGKARKIGPLVLCKPHSQPKPVRHGGELRWYGTIGMV